MYSDTYGAIYNWYAVDTKVLCPAGWHIPSDDEWKTLNYLDYTTGSLNPETTSGYLINGRAQGNSVRCIKD